MKNFLTASILTAFLLIAYAIGQTSSTPKEAVLTQPALTQHATGPFNVKLTPQDDKLGDGISRMLLEKHYHGDMEGASKGQMLAAGSAKTSGVYVAIETFTGTLQGKTGSFSLHHTGIMTKAGPNLTISVVPDSGTGQLTGINGRMEIKIAPDGKHSYDFEYTLPSQ
jgi:hypothetical protein